MEALGYVASLVMGITIGLLGGGGSILTVPILVYLFAIRPSEASTASLFIVGCISLIASVQYKIKNVADWKTGILFSLPSLVGIFVARSVVLPVIPDVIELPFGISLEKDSLILVTFAVLMIAASTSMIRVRSLSAVETRTQSTVLVGLQGMVVGFVTGFVGAGGGFLILPVLVNVLMLPMKVAIGTSLFIIAINSLFGFSVSALSGAAIIDWHVQLMVLALGLAGSFIGAKLSGKMDEQKLKKMFGWFILSMGVIIILERVA